MIRDPSDGSVREQSEEHSKLRPPPGSLNSRTTAARQPVGPVIDTTTSGLQTGSSKPENLARLEKSREWLENYRKNPLQFRSGQPREGN